MNLRILFGADYQLRTHQVPIGQPFADSAQHIGRWDSEDALGRAGTRWTTLLLELRSGAALRAVDQIEGILNRDKKVATYKLALFRA